jgi:Bacterial PH domain
VPDAAPRHLTTSPSIVRKWSRKHVSILSSLLGHASAFEPAEAQKEYGRLLADGEAVEGAFRLVRDVILFTNRRMIFVDKQGMTGRKTEYMSVPYRSIVRFSIESAGHFDLEAELKIWVSGSAEPIQRTFNRKLDVYALQAVLAGYVGR